MEALLGLFSVLAGWLTGIASEFASWFHQPLTNFSLVVFCFLGVFTVARSNRQREKKLERRLKDFERLLSALCSQVHDIKFDVGSYRQSEGLKNEMQGHQQYLKAMFDDWMMRQQLPKK